MAFNAWIGMLMEGRKKVPSRRRVNPQISEIDKYCREMEIEVRPRDMMREGFYQQSRIERGDTGI